MDELQVLLASVVDDEFHDDVHDDNVDEDDVHDDRVIDQLIEVNDNDEMITELLIEIVLIIEINDEIMMLMLIDDSMIEQMIERETLLTIELMQTIRTIRSMVIRNEMNNKISQNREIKLHEVHVKKKN